MISVGDAQAWPLMSKQASAVLHMAGMLAPSAAICAPSGALPQRRPDQPAVILHQPAWARDQNTGAVACGAGELAGASSVAEVAEASLAELADVSVDAVAEPIVGASVR